MSNDSVRDMIALCNWYIGVLGDHQGSVGLMMRETHVAIDKLRTDPGNFSETDAGHIAVVQAYVAKITGVPVAQHGREAIKNVRKDLEGG